MSKGRGSIPSLTGVRGIAALWVFLTHFYGFTGRVFGMPSLMKSSFLFNGFRGVDLFFILSGFILMHVHATDFTTISWPALKRFFILRFFRIYPLNTVILVALVPLVLLAPSYVAAQRAFTDPHFAYRVHNLSAAGFVQTLLLAQSWTILKLGEWNIVSWTLSAEVLGYALFPALTWIIVRESSWRRCIIYATCSLVVLTILLFLSHHANNNPTGTFGSVRMFFCFWAGICLYRCYQLAPDTLADRASAITCAAIFFIALTLFFPPSPVFDSFGFAALVFGLAYRRGPINSLMETRPSLYLGKISFSFYLSHFLIIDIISWSAGSWLMAQAGATKCIALIAIFLLCLGVASVLYQWVERPSQRFGHYLSSRAKPRIGKDAATNAVLANSNT
jgi:peptidoglycan/LPS O-acetylase OafA/YrhL